MEESLGPFITTHITQHWSFLIQALDEDLSATKVTNTGDVEESLGSFQLKCTSDGIEVFFKFHRTVKCGPGNSVTVWSSDSGRSTAPVRDSSSHEGRGLEDVDTNTIHGQGGDVCHQDLTKEKEAFGTSRRFTKGTGEGLYIAADLELESWLPEMPRTRTAPSCRWDVVSWLL